VAVFDPEPLKEIARGLLNQLPDVSAGRFDVVGQTLTAISPPAPDAEEPVGGGKLKTRPHKESGEFCDSRAMHDSSKSLP